MLSLHFRRRACRKAEGAAYETEFEHLSRALDSARAEASTLAANTAPLEAQLAAKKECTRDLSARHVAPGAERDALLERATTLDVRLEQSRKATTNAQRTAEAERHEGLALRAQVERLGSELRAAGVDSVGLPSLSHRSDPT